MAAVDDLMQIGVERFKIGSGDLSNLPLLQYIAECEKPVIVSNGLRSDEQLDEAVNLLSKKHNRHNNISLHIFVPPHLQNVHLNQIGILGENTVYQLVYLTALV